MLTIVNGTHFSYVQVEAAGKVVDSFYGGMEPKPVVKDHTRDKIIAVVVMGCSLVFLCYFIYSWVSCYMKKPKVREAVPQGGHEEGSGEGYDMRPVGTVP